MIFFNFKRGLNIKAVLYLLWLIFMNFSIKETLDTILAHISHYIDDLKFQVLPTMSMNNTNLNQTLTYQLFNIICAVNSLLSNDMNCYLFSEIVINIFS